MATTTAKIRTTIYLSPELWQQARIAALATNRSASALIESLLEAYLWSQDQTDGTMRGVKEPDASASDPAHQAGETRPIISEQLDRRISDESGFTK